MTLAADVAKAAIEEASLRAQIAATRRIIDLEQQRLALLELQFAHGAVPGTDINLQQSALAQARRFSPVLKGGSRRNAMS